MTTIQIPAGANIDPFLKAHRSRTSFRLRGGQFYSDGAYAFRDFDFTMLGDGCELEGDGAHATLLTVSPIAVPPDACQAELLTAGSRSGRSERVAVSHLSVSPSPVFGRPDIGIVGLHIWSDRCVVRDVAIYGINGTRQAPGTPSREGFGLLVNQPGDPYSPGCSEISDVTVKIGSPRGETEHFVCGCYVGIENPKGASFVERIRVINAGPSPAHAAFGINGEVMGQSWTNEGRWNRAIFCDVTGGANTMISGAMLTAERVGVELRGKTRLAWKSIGVWDSQITLRPPAEAEYAAGLVIVDDSADQRTVQFADVRIYGSSLVAIPSKAGQTFFRGSADAALVRGCGLVNCCFAGPVSWASRVLTKITPHAGFEVL